MDIKRFSRNISNVLKNIKNVSKNIENVSMNIEKCFNDFEIYGSIREFMQGKFRYYTSFLRFMEA